MHLPSTSEMDAIAERNARESPLLRLPGEIRNEIYTYLLSGRRNVLIRSGYFKELSRCEIRPDELSILVVCRQSYQEAHALPFALSTWTLDDPSQLASITLCRFGDHQLREMRYIHVECALGYFTPEDVYLGCLKGKNVLVCDFLPCVRDIFLGTDTNFKRLFTYVPGVFGTPAETIVAWEKRNVEELRKQWKVFQHLKNWLLQGMGKELRIWTDLEGVGDEKGHI